MEMRRTETVSDGGSGRGLVALAAAACLLGLSVGAGGALLLADCANEGTYAVPAASIGGATYVYCVNGTQCASSYTLNSVTFNACGGYSQGTYCDKIGTVAGQYWQNGSCNNVQGGCWPPMFVTPVKIDNYVAKGCPPGG